MENLSRTHRADETFEDELRSDAKRWIEAAPVDVPSAGVP
jgi:hypothetical protein